MENEYVVHGLDLSYFTGKIEAYLRAKGLAYRLQEMTIGDLRRCAKVTGIEQMPQIQCPDGSWLTDTTMTMAYLEEIHPEPAISPQEPAVRFVSLLLEDFADEWLWRPALYYRWAFRDDAQLNSGRIARAMMRRSVVPLWFARQAVLRRQKREFLREDGVTSANRSAVKALYLETLEAMESILSTRPFILGPRPTQADFGFFGPMFRHFSSDPTPSRIMRSRAPAVLDWVGRMWNLRPMDFENKPMPFTMPSGLAPLFKIISGAYLPYLSDNAKAVNSEIPSFTRTDHGVQFIEAANPYRAFCFDMLQAEYANLSATERNRVKDCLDSDEAAEILGGPRIWIARTPVNRLPIEPDTQATPIVNHRWIVKNPPKATKAKADADA